MEILVVEDEVPIADFLRRGLETEGYEVTTASDGGEGERLALGGGFDLVILDRMLPVCDGIEVLTTIRRERPTLPVIVLTAMGEVADRVEGLDKGAIDYMTKPFAFNELVARVRAHLRQPTDDSTTVLRAAGLKLDLLARRVERDSLSVSLPEREAGAAWEAGVLHRHDCRGRVCSRLCSDPASAAELRTLAEAFNHMLDRLDDAFSRQRQWSRASC